MAYSTPNLSQNDYAHLSIDELEKEIEATQSKLDQLPQRLIRESGGTLGTQVIRRENEPAKAWIEVDLEDNRSFDSIVIVPAVMIDETTGASNHNFPQDFQIRTYLSKEDQVGKLLFDSTQEPRMPPSNLSPLIINCPRTSARRIRFTPFKLFSRFSSPPHSYSLSELLVFDGDSNIALGKPVICTRVTKHAPIWGKSYLTDGYMPYSEPSILDNDRVSNCRIFISAKSQTLPSITLDLGQEQQLDEIRLYPAHEGKNFAVFHRTAMGFPRQFKIEVSNDLSFRSSTLVFDSKGRDYPSPGHHLACFSTDGISARYIRVSAQSLPQHPQKKGFLLAFAEIEAISNGDNVSRGAKVILSHTAEMKRAPASELVDGLSANGTILKMRSWLGGLSERNRIEDKLENLQSALKERYLEQSRNVQRLSWGIGIALLLMPALYWWQRHTRLHQMYQMRENLAADLHDEIGADFSGIALISEDLSSKEDMPQPYLSQLSTITKVSRDSATNARALVRFLESRQVRGNLKGEMQATAQLLLNNHRYNLEFSGYKHVRKLEPKDKWHVLLFFKEALNNIVKHADATEVEISFKMTSNRLRLSIQDNGRGLAANNHQKPDHLAIRAKKLNAQFDIPKDSNKGTTINLEKKL